MANHFRQCIQSFREGVGEAVVHGAQRIRCNLRSRKIGRTLQADGETVQARPPRFATIVIFDALARKLRRTRRNQR